MSHDAWDAAEELIGLLEERAGFDEWWEQIDVDIRWEIQNEIATWLDRRTR